MSVVGIDLGTTNTVVGCVHAGKVHVLADEKGVRLLPSVVSFHPNGEVLVGTAAKARRLIDARNTVYSHKRLIGRSWGSPEIAQARRRLPFELKEGPGQGVLVRARGQDYTLPEVSAFVLKRARQIAEQALGTPVDRAVITVPAHFNELQRASTKVAGRVSGLEILRILNEPTAAALAYGLGRAGNERVAVYDLGGGTFDCTLLDLNGNVFEVLATAGDSFLGGDDIDNLVADRMAETFLARHRQDPRQDPQLYERLKTTAEEVKIALSTAETHTVTLTDFGFGPGGSSLTFQFTMTRRDLEALVAPLVDRSFKVTQDALSLARLSPGSFDKVILVGGSTRMPLVRRQVEMFFGITPLDRVNPDEVVAIGAAIQAAALTDGVKQRNLSPATPRTAFSSAPPGFGQAPPTQKPSTRPGIATAPQPFARSLLGNRLPSTPPSEETLTRGPEFGTIDEPPSLVTTSPAGVTMPEGQFGAVAELSLISTTGAGLPSPKDAETQARQLPFDLGTSDGPTEPFERQGNTLQIDPRQNATAPLAPRAPNVGALPPAPYAQRTQTRPPPAGPYASAPPPAAYASRPPPQPFAFGSAPPPPLARGDGGQSFSFPPPPAVDPSAPLNLAGFGGEMAATAPSGAYGAPVLVDVTPRGLVVETVGGYCDTIIPRNSKIPCERTRRFATGRDLQTSVRVRVAQGESPSFPQNTYLGEVELSGLRPARRGEVTVAVTFELDADGTLRIRARDVQTGLEARATLQLIGVADEPSVAMMMNRLAQRPVVGSS